MNNQISLGRRRIDELRRVYQGTSGNYLQMVNKHRVTCISVSVICDGEQSSTSRKLPQLRLFSFSIQ